LTTRRQRTPTPQPERLQRTSSWAGLKKGDRVEVAGTGLRSAQWEFVAHVTNTDTAEDWVEVVGGVHGDRKVRSFAPSRIFAPDNRRGQRGLSLADAPRLPLE
jgi:hypothetical protein